MLGFDTDQWAVLLLVLVLGWLLGLLSRSGGSKWRRAYEAERTDHLSHRTAHDAALATAHARIAELERATPVAAAAPIATPAATDPARDDLSLIRGIGPDGEARLNAQGLHRYRDIAAIAPADEPGLEARMGIERGTVARERWREQADLLANGRHDEHRRLFN